MSDDWSKTLVRGIIIAIVSTFLQLPLWLTIFFFLSISFVIGLIIFLLGFLIHFIIIGFVAEKTIKEWIR